MFENLDEVLIKYEDINIYDVIDVMEALAYRTLHYRYPTWHSIPEEEIVQLLREEGISAYIEKDL